MTYGNDIRLKVKSTLLTLFIDLPMCDSPRVGAINCGETERICFLMREKKDILWKIHVHTHVSTVYTYISSSLEFFRPV